jgi:hypothetical protein
MRTKGLHIKAENDLRELPTYGIAEAAHYLQIPGTTLPVVGRRALVSDREGNALLRTFN